LIDIVKPYEDDDDDDDDDELRYREYFRDVKRLS
jgi:hypothetical protein